MKMKALIIIAVLMLAVCAKSQGTVNSRYVFSNYVTQPAAVTQITLTPLQPDYNYTNAILAPIPMTRVTSTSGVYTYSNLVVGYSYKLELKVGLNSYFFTNNYPLGLTNTASGYVDAGLYTGFWVGQIFAYYQPNGIVYQTNSTITYSTNFYNVTNNLSGTNFGVAVSGTGGATVSTNGNTFTVNVPLQTDLTNLLGSMAYQASSAFISTSSLPSLTNSFLTSSATNGLLQSSVYVAGTNAIATTATAQISATNAALTASLIASNSAQSANLNSASNFLANTKQPASLILSNLSVTGAFTNGLVNGTNTTLSTNVLGQVAYNVQTPTFLTNGITGTAYQPLGYYVATNQLSSLTNGFITSASLAPYATTGYVQSAISSSNANLVSISTMNASNALTLSAANAQATNLVLAQGLSSTNFQLAMGLSITNLINQNGVNATNWGLVISNSILAAISSTNNANLTTTTNLVLAFGMAATNYANVVGLASTNLTLFTSNFLSTNGLANLQATNTAILATVNSLIGNATNGVFVTSTNGNATALSVWGNLNLANKTNFLISTNIVGIVGSGSGVDGTYLGGAYSTTWTNTANTTNTVLLSGGNYYVQSNGVSMYQSSNAVVWTLVNGAAPAPSGSFGSFWDMNGVIVHGWISSTNLTQRFNSLTNGGVTYGPITNNAFSSLATNIINALALAQAVAYTTNFSSPTNGINSAQATNIVMNYGGTLFQPIGNYQPASANLTNWATLDTNVLSAYTNSGAAKWGATSNYDATAARPMTLYYCVTNAIQYFLVITN